MSESQAQGATVSVANFLSNRKEFAEWKLYKKGKPTDFNTLPTPTKISQTEP